MVLLLHYYLKSLHHNMKIHILFEKGVKNKSVNWIINTAKEYFENKFVGVHIDQPINLDFTSSETKVKHEYILGGIQSEGRRYFTTNYFSKVDSSEIPEGTDTVIYLYNNTFKTTGSDYVAPRTYPIPIKKGVHYFEMYTDFEQLSPTAPVHELMHILCIKLSDKGFIPRGVSDNMDITYINGVAHTYLENSNPLSKTGNFAVTFNHIKTYLKYINSDSKATVIQKIQAQLLYLKEQLNKSTSIPFTYPENFLKALEVILKHEGGYINDPKDKGGETNMGISKRAYPNENIKNMTVARAKEIYYKDYWLASSCDKMDFPIALITFDMSVNAGVITSIKLLQQSVGTIADGVVGNNTLNAIKNANAFSLSEERVKYYAKLPGWDNYKNGWISRVFKTLELIYK